MSLVVLRQILPIDPGDKDGFPFIWERDLRQRGCVISSSEFSIYRVVGKDGMELLSPTGRIVETSHTDYTALAIVTGFVEGEAYVIRNRITTTSGLTLTRSTLVQCAIL